MRGSDLLGVTPFWDFLGGFSLEGQAIGMPGCWIGSGFLLARDVRVGALTFHTGSSPTEQLRYEAGLSVMPTTSQWSQGPPFASRRDIGCVPQNTLLTLLSRCQRARPAASFRSPIQRPRDA